MKGLQASALLLCALAASAYAQVADAAAGPVFESAIGFTAPLAGGQTRLGCAASFGMVRDVHHIALMGDFAFPLSAQDSRLGLDREVTGNFYGLGVRYTRDFPGLLKSGLFCPALALGWYRAVSASDSIDFVETYPLSLSPQFSVSGQRMTILLDPAVYVGFKRQNILRHTGRRDRIADGIGVLFAPRFMFSFVF